MDEQPFPCRRSVDFRFAAAQRLCQRMADASDDLAVGASDVCADEDRFRRLGRSACVDGGSRRDLLRESLRHGFPRHGPIGWRRTGHRERLGTCARRWRFLPPPASRSAFCQPMSYRCWTEPPRRSPRPARPRRSFRHSSMRRRSGARTLQPEFLAEFHDLGANIGGGALPGRGLVVLHRGEEQQSRRLRDVDLLHGCRARGPAGVIFVAFKALTRGRSVVRRPAWDGGLRRLWPSTTYTATGFSNPVRVVFQALAAPQGCRGEHRSGRAAFPHCHKTRAHGRKRRRPPGAWRIRSMRCGSSPTPFGECTSEM